MAGKSRFSSGISSGLTIGILVLICNVDGRPDGAPTSACTNLTPMHLGQSPQSSTAPFSIIPTTQSYTPGTNLAVNVVNVGNEHYTGILMQARAVGSTTPVGSWSSLNLPGGTKTIMCSNPADSVTHSNSVTKPATTVYTWIPPSMPVGNIEFVATFAVSREVYYVGAKSQTVFKPCGNGGTYYQSSTTAGYICVCADNYEGTHCEVTINPCLNSPCVNGGTCFQGTTSGTYTCICLTGYSGRNCEAFTLCLTGACMNGGTCLQSSSAANIFCLCTPGYEGDRCQTTVNLCSTNPCQNGGTCLQSSDRNSYTCICLPTYTGTNCETVVMDSNPCSTSPCENGGTCYQGSTSSTYVCTCPVGYSGTNCD
ncbi:delta-like protein C, partial [Anneissia japonica]|uniref:delta-like protein C n=1 Tax=Anneissia japonica TaxID=1529436 RepID=UPI001425A37F